MYWMKRRSTITNVSRIWPQKCVKSVQLERYDSVIYFPEDLDIAGSTRTFSVGLFSHNGAAESRSKEKAI